MIKRKILHKLKNINLNYKEPLKTTNYEKLLLRQYIALHDELAEMQEYAERCYPKFERIRAEVDKLLPRIMKLTESYKKHHKYAEQIKQYVMVDFKEIQLFFEKVFNNNEKIEHFQTDLLKLSDYLHRFDDPFDLFYKRSESFPDKIGAFEDYTHELFRNYKKYCLNIVSFDKDFELFKGCFEVFDETYSKYYRIRETTVEAYNNMIGQVKILYKLVEDVDTEMVKIRQNGLFTDRSDEFNDINLN